MVEKETNSVTAIDCKIEQAEKPTEKVEKPKRRRTRKPKAKTPPELSTSPNQPMLSMPKLDNTVSRLQYRLRVPEESGLGDGYNFIGRLFGPQGSTIRQIEAESGCLISVFGRDLKAKKKRQRRKKNKQAVDDEEKETTPAEDAALVESETAPPPSAEPSTTDQPVVKRAVEVVVSAQASDYAYAQYKLNMVTAILTRVPYDDLKRRQLTEVAKEKGTYKAEKDKNKNTTGPMTLSEQLGSLHLARMQQQRLLVERANDTMAAEAVMQRQEQMATSAVVSEHCLAPQGQETSEYEYMRPMAPLSQYEMPMLNQLQYVPAMTQHPYAYMQPSAMMAYPTNSPMYYAPVMMMSQYGQPTTTATAGTSALINPYEQQGLPSEQPPTNYKPAI